MLSHPIATIFVAENEKEAVGDILDCLTVENAGPLILAQEPVMAALHDLLSRDCWTNLCLVSKETLQWLFYKRRIVLNELLHLTTLFNFAEILSRHLTSLHCTFYGQKDYQMLPSDALTRAMKSGSQFRKMFRNVHRLSLEMIDMRVSFAVWQSTVCQLSRCLTNNTLMLKPTELSLLRCQVDLDSFMEPSTFKSLKHLAWFHSVLESSMHERKLNALFNGTHLAVALGSPLNTLIATDLLQQRNITHLFVGIGISAAGRSFLSAIQELRCLTFLSLKDCTLYPQELFDCLPLSIGEVHLQISRAHFYKELSLVIADHLVHLTQLAVYSACKRLSLTLSSHVQRLHLEVGQSIELMKNQQDDAASSNLKDLTVIVGEENLSIYNLAASYPKLETLYVAVKKNYFSPTANERLSNSWICCQTLQERLWGESPTIMERNTGVPVDIILTGLGSLKNVRVAGDRCFIQLLDSMKLGLSEQDLGRLLQSEANPVTFFSLLNGSDVQYHPFE